MVNVDDYPFVKKHLLKYISSLETRTDKGNTPFNLRNCAYVDDFLKEKIIYPETTVRRGEFVYDNSAIFTDKTCFIITGEHLKYINLILSSKLYVYYLENKLRLVGKITIQYSKQYIVEIPIINPINEQFYTEKADFMLSLNKNLQDILLKFRNNLVREFGLDDLPTKLQNWHLLSYPDFLKEIEKKKVKLSLSQKAEWEEYFTTEHKKANEIKSNIEQTDKEIDQMVYVLYGLTEEEIEIVEKSYN